MTRSLPIVCYLFTLIVLTLNQACNATNMNYVSRFTLGKQDQLNRTFTKIQTKLKTMENLLYKDNMGAQYFVKDIKIEYRYFDSKQKADFRGESVILISGGVLEVQCSFNWSRTFFTVATGSATALGLTDDITFAKKLAIQGKAYSYELIDILPTVLDKSGFSFTRIEPPNVTDSDKTVLLQMLNKLDGFRDLKTVLFDQMQTIIRPILTECLHDQNFPIQNKFEYKWAAGNDRKNITVPFSRRPVSVDAQKIGLISSSELQIENASVWRCGSRKVPDMPLDQKQFGGIQEYMNFDFYQNVIRWAASEGMLDSQLKRENWGNRIFRFYAGDLYEVFPQIQSNFYANQAVIGKCSAYNLGSNIVTKHQSDSFNVTLSYSCSLAIKADKITDFNVALTSTITGLPNKDTLDFAVRSFSYKVQFIPNGKYQLGNKDLAELMVGDSLKRIYEGRVFGSGWPQSPPRDYPHFKVYENYTVIFDSSLVSSFLEV